MSIVVTGASGHLGRLVSKALFRHASPSEIILVTRTPDALKPHVPKGVQVRSGDFARPESLKEAFDGAKRALIISTMPPGDIVQMHRTAFENAARSGVEHIVYTSFANPVAENPAPPAVSQAKSEAILISLGINWTLMRNALYTDYRVNIAKRYAELGYWGTNAGDGAHAFVSRADCAETAAVVVTSKGHENRIYDITGPELIDASTYTNIMNNSLQRRISSVKMGDDEYENFRSLASTGNDGRNYVELYSGTGAAIRNGYMNQLSNSVFNLTGQLPVSMEEMFQHREQI